MTFFSKDRIFGFVFLVSIPFLLFGVSFLSAEKEILTCEMDLADWGFEDPSDVGYLSVGVVHKDSGDALVVYDVRAKRPVIEHLRVPKRRIPPIQDKVFLLDDFHQGNTNRLGGYFSRIVRVPSESRVTIDKSTDGRRSLCFTYRQKAPGFAGFWIHLFDFKRPPVERTFMNAAPFRFLTFTIMGDNGNERLMLQVADHDWERREDSLRIGQVGQFLPSGKIQTSWQRAWVPLDRFPERIKKEELASLVFLAQSGKGCVHIGDIAFTEERDVPIPGAAEREARPPSPHRGMWLWNTEDLLGRDKEQSRLVDFCRQSGITEVFMQLPYTIEAKNGILWDERQVAALLARLHKAGIKVHALDGDPRFALEEWHGHVLATIRSVIQFNRSMRTEERFAGIRYDNEPYLLPNFGGVQKQSIIDQYLMLLRQSEKLTDSAGLEFGVDIPFWFDQKNEFFEPITEVENRPLTQCILDIVDNIGIMDYRTDAYGADGVIAHALGELQYASAKGKRVFIGLETASLPDETIFEYGRANGPTGIHIEKMGGTKVLLRFNPGGVRSGTEENLFLFQQQRTFVPAGKLTFAGRSIGEMADVMEKAESEFQKYPGFYGFAIHYYQSFRKLSGLKTSPALSF